MLPQTVQLRREIHRHPELGNQLPKTRASVLQALQPLDLDVRLSQSTSGIVAVLERAMSGPSNLQAYLDMPAPLMGAEDFSLLLQRTPGAMAFLGVAPDGVDPATASPCHSNRMQLNESAMVHGVALHAAVACDFLHQHG